MKISEIIAKVEVYHGPLEEGRKTCDIVQYGNPDQECTGIVTTCCPTAAVIQKAAELGYNFVLGHEPLFFDGWDETDWLQENSVYQAKKKLLDETGIVVYRDHDHMHNQKPDGIFSGLTKKLGWEQYVSSEGFMPGCVYDLPATTVKAVANHLNQVMGISGMRIVGDPDMEVTRAAVVFHFLGGSMDRVGIDFIDKHDVQVIIPGETVDWTVVEYVQDALALGKKRALLTPGHFNWEEPGMAYMAEWLPQVIGEQVPVKFIQSGNQYTWIESTEK